MGLFSQLFAGKSDLGAGGSSVFKDSFRRTEPNAAKLASKAEAQQQMHADVQPTKKAAKESERKPLKRKEKSVGKDATLDDDSRSQKRAKSESKAGATPASPTSAAAPKDAPADDAATTEQLVRTIFVGNLPGSVKSKALAKYFASCGAVESVRLRSLAIKEGVKMPRKAAVASGNVEGQKGSTAFVVFESKDAIPKALKLNMREVEP
jgi:nucleolar protein 12